MIQLARMRSVPITRFQLAHLLSLSARQLTNLAWPRILTL